MNWSGLAFLIPGLIIGFVVGKISDFEIPSKQSFAMSRGLDRIERAEFRAAYLELRNTLDRAVNCKQAVGDFDAGFWQGRFQELRKSTEYTNFAEDVKTVDADIQIARKPAQFECPIAGNTEPVKTADMMSKIKRLEKSFRNLKTQRQ
jgi:hypothetical protein